MVTALFILVLGINVLIFSYLLLNKPSAIILTVITIIGTTIGIYIEAKFSINIRVSKIYLTIMFALAFIKFGNVENFRIYWWEFLLVAFFVIRLGIDLLRPDFALRGMFGGIGDGIFLTAGYFFFKKAFMRDPEQIELVLKIFIYSSVCFALIGIIEYIMKYDIFETEASRFIIEGHQRSNSIFTSPEYFGLLSAISIYVSIFLAIKKMISKSSVYILLSIFFISLFVCLYRGIWLAFIAGGIIMYFAILVKSKYKIGLLITAVSLVIIFGFSLYGITYSLSKESFYGKRIKDIDNIANRMIIYRELSHGISNHYWVGNGTATVAEYLKSLGLQRQFGSRRTTTVHPHNAILAILYENGIFLLAIFICWFAFLLLPYRSRDIYAYSTSSAIMVGFFFAGIGLAIIPTFNLPYFMMVVLAAYNMSFFQRNQT
jgi:hypothetical protein